MELRHVKAFVATAEELHFGRAAARLYIAQPALSQQVKQLESELGVTLFDRSTRRVSLTDAGRALLPAARRLLDDVELLRRAVRVSQADVVGRVRIGYAGASSQQVLPTLSRAVRAQHPGIELVLQSHTNAHAAARGVKRGELDIGFARLPLPETGLAHHVYAREELVVVMPTDHPLATPGAIHPRELAREPFVTFTAGSGSSLRDALFVVARNAGFVPDVVQEAQDTYTIMGLVDVGVGITVTASSVLHITSPTLMHRTLLSEPRHLDACLVWRPDTTSQATRAVVDIAREVLPAPH